MFWYLFFYIYTNARIISFIAALNNINKPRHPNSLHRARRGVTRTGFPSTSFTLSAIEVLRVNFSSCANFTNLNSQHWACEKCDPHRIRTCNQLLKRQLLYHWASGPSCAPGVPKMEHYERLPQQALLYFQELGYSNTIVSLTFGWSLCLGVAVLLWSSLKIVNEHFVKLLL